MTIRRDDLVAAAALGLLQCRQIDPLLIFLLQRDVCARRGELLAHSRSAPAVRKNHGLLSCLVGIAAAVAAAWVALLFTMPAVESLGVGVLFFFTLLYAVPAIGLATWYKQRGFGAPARILATLALSFLPLAVFALQNVSR
jgi:hypothetical protein